jgi:hypothetical protein
VKHDVTRSLHVDGTRMKKRDTFIAGGKACVRYNINIGLLISLMVGITPMTEDTDKIHYRICEIY